MKYYYHQDAIHVSRVDLLVNDLDISLDFYLNSLGFSVLNKNDEYVSLTVDYETELIRLYENKFHELSDNMNIYHFALLLPKRKDLSKFLHHLIEKQIPIDGAADHIVSEAIYLRDPDNIGIEITCDKDDSDWEYNNEKIKMGTLPFDYKGVYYEKNENDLFTGLPKDTIIGHLHLQVDNLEKSKDFYHNIIGFKVMNEEIRQAVFMADKKYHHHLAINTWHSNMKSKANASKMKSFEITYPNCEKFIYTYENLKKANVEYLETSEGIQIKNIENSDIYLKI
jgi:catechol 2,3-dioxygenase